MTHQERVAFEHTTPEVSALTKKYYEDMRNIEDTELIPAITSSQCSPLDISDEIIGIQRKVFLLMQNYLSDRRRLLGIDNKVD